MIARVAEKGEIRIFVNTKNVRLAKKSKHKRGFEKIGYQEVYQMAHENIENFLCLSNIFLQSLKESQNAAFVNVVNTKGDDE